MNLNSRQESQLERIKNQLKVKNIRLTQIRLEILKIIIVNDHPTISDIIDSLEAEFGKVNIMSVYNTLDMLLENHILFANTFNGKQICYEIQVQESGHLKCDQCLRVEHINPEELALFLENVKKVATNHHYSFEHFKIEIHGICSSCNAKNKLSKLNKDKI